MNLTNLSIIGILLSIVVLLVVLILVLLMRHRLKESQIQLQRAIEKLEEDEPDVQDSIEHLEKVLKTVDSII